MILRTMYGGNRELRYADYPHTLIPPPWFGMGSTSGVAVTEETATGLPAVGRAIRLIGGLIGASPICVFEGKRGDRRERSDTPQAMLLDNPYPGESAFDWRYDIAVSLEATENAFIRKIKTTRRKIVALQVIPPRFVNARINRNGDREYEISTGAQWVPVPASEILHIRGQTVEGGTFGVSRIQQHRDPLGAMIAAQKFEGSFFRNSARPDFVMNFPQGVSIEQGRQWKAEWDSQHQGVDNAGQARAIGGGATVQPIPVSMRDAQFVETRNLSVSDVARIMDVEELLLGGGQGEQQDVQAMDRFLAFQVPPRLARIEQALRADPDLFPDNDLYPQFESNPLMFASPTTRASVQHQEIQAGTLLPDEARADNGRPPLPDGVGMIPQVTPVGGAPNPEPIHPPDDEAARHTIINVLPDTSEAAELRTLIAGLTRHQPPTIEVDARSTINMPDQPAPHIDVHVPEQSAPDVIVQMPEQTAPDVRVDVHVPEQATPVVNIDARAADQPAPVVNVNVEPTPVNVDVRVPKQPPAQVNVAVEAPNKHVKFKRDRNGNIVDAITEDA